MRSHKKTQFLLAVCALAWPLTFLSAESLPFGLEIPVVFSDNMVLQRDVPCNIWGTGDPGSTVTVTFNDQKKNVAVAASGTWSLKLDPMQAQGNGKNLVIHSRGKEVTFKNVVVGDVWICSGQSNMGIGVERIKDISPELLQQVINTTDFPNLRYMQVRDSFSPVKEKTEAEVIGGWTPLIKSSDCTTVKKCSAIAFFFARKLHQELNVPIGFIRDNVGATAIEAWMSGNTLRSSATGKVILDSWAAIQSKYSAEQMQEYAGKQLAAAEIKGDAKEIEKWTNPAKWPKEPILSQNYPGACFNGMIAPLSRMTIKGFIWDQGESNSSRAWQYRELLSLLITNWRTYWKQGNGEGANSLPFYIVQLQELGKEIDRSNPSLNKQSTAVAEIRDAQRFVADTTPQCAIVVTADHHENGNTHPLLKTIPGERLAAAALANTYGKDIVWRGPTFKSQKIEGEKIRIEFDGTGKGLMVGRRSGTNVNATPIDQPLDSFAIAGQDGVYAWAQATIEGNTVVVWSDKVKNPQSVRYAWAGNPEGCNLYNKDGWPATPFRTDALPYSTKGKEDPLEREKSTDLFFVPR